MTVTIETNIVTKRNRKGAQKEWELRIYFNISPYEIKGTTPG